MEPLKHECGIALVRLLKPLEYYQRKYGTWTIGLNKLYLMMEKQHNRGQEGAGLACLKLNGEPGDEYMFRERAQGANAITEIFATVNDNLNAFAAEKLQDANFAERSMPFAGELYMGHLRYSTTGKSGLKYVHPFLRRDNWRAKNLCICGNFNMTNVEEIFESVTGQGQWPRIYSDGYVMLEQMGHRLDREVERNFVEAKSLGLQGLDITRHIEDNVKVENVLKTSLVQFDGGYVVCGMTGSGEMFAARDPWGIRPAYYYRDDEFVAAASERSVLQTCFDLECSDVKEIEPGMSLIVRRSGECVLERITDQKGDYRCSFERIYFSRGSDRDIYKERKKLGEQLTEPILKAVDYDVEHTVFSFIPNTAEVAFYGMVEGVRRYIDDKKMALLESLDHKPTRDELERIMGMTVRSEKVAWKDIKLRTFIAQGNSRNDLASHVYDITYESIRSGVDNLVVIDDSIVRGTTLKNSILRILNRLHPKKIVIVSSAPQIRYPDYYGIDMPCLEELCIFRAAIELIKERGMFWLIDDVYHRCLEEMKKEKDEMHNIVRCIYEPFTAEELNKKTAEMLCPDGVSTPIEFVYQSIEGLHNAIPCYHGDWYFTGHFPTPGGIRLCNQAFINFVENVYQNEQKF